MNPKSLSELSTAMRDALDSLMDAYEPGTHNEIFTEACISATEFLIWAAEMAASGRSQDAGMSRTMLLAAARAKIDEAATVSHSAMAAMARRPQVAYSMVAAE